MVGLEAGNYCMHLVHDSVTLRGKVLFNISFNRKISHFLVECYAEAIYAESNFVYAFSTFFGEPNLISLLKAAYKAKTANSIFKLVTVYS